MIARELPMISQLFFYCEFRSSESSVVCSESGLKPGFHENLTYDHSSCCEEKGISQQCKSMCKPNEMDTHHFDPTSCKNTDYQAFLGCVTEGGERAEICIFILDRDTVGKRPSRFFRQPQPRALLQSSARSAVLLRFLLRQL